MDDKIIIDGILFKQSKINSNYYVSENGEVYSAHSKKIIKHNYKCKKNKRYAYVDMYVDGKQKHIPIHKLVYETWVGNIPEGSQVNHKDDNQLNNNVDNLYVGTQKDNIKDCIENSHRVGNIFYLTLLDKEEDKIITFCPSSDFIPYSGHTCANGSVNRMFNKNWFKKKYNIIEFRSINNLSELKGVTTMIDECKSVG